MEKQNAQTRMDYLLARDRERQIKQQGYDDGYDTGYDSGKDYGIHGTVSVLRKLNYSPSDIVGQLMSTYELDEATAEKYLK